MKLRECTKIEIAKTSIKRGLSFDLIADITGFTVEEIEDLATAEKK